MIRKIRPYITYPFFHLRKRILLTWLRLRGRHSAAEILQWAVHELDIDKQTRMELLQNGSMTRIYNVSIEELN